MQRVSQETVETYTVTGQEIAQALGLWYDDEDVILVVPIDSGDPDGIPTYHLQVFGETEEAIDIPVPDARYHDENLTGLWECDGVVTFLPQPPPEAA